MANFWQNIKDKLDAQAPPAQQSDWEAMRQKIGEHPQLAPKTAKLWPHGAAALGLFTLVAVLVYGLWPMNTEPLNRAPKEPAQTNQPRITEPKQKVPEPKSQPQEERSLSGTPNTIPGLPSERVNANSGQKEAPAQGFSAVPPALEKPGKRPPPAVSKEYSEKPTSLASITVNEPEAASLESGDKTQTAEVKRTKEREQPTLAASGKDPDSGEDKTSLETQNSRQAIAPKNGPAALADSAFTVANKGLDAADKENNPAGQAEGSPALPAVADEKQEFIPREWGFKLAQLNAVGMVHHSLAAPQVLSVGAGVEAVWARKNWRFTTGLYAGQARLSQNEIRFNQFTQIDSSLIPRLEQRVEARVTAVWVIDSFFSGRYVYDTAFVNVTDTILQRVYDTSQVETQERLRNVSRFTYVEMPVLAGYSFGQGPWNYSLRGGVLLNQLTQLPGEGAAGGSHLGLDLMLQPGVAYRLNNRWELYLRTTLRRPVFTNALLQEGGWRGGTQIGLSYYFR
jgi:hypothetical protein